MNRKTLLIVWLSLSIILLAQDRHMYLYDSDGQKTTIPVDSIRNVSFMMNQTHTIRVLQRDGLQTESKITGLDKITFVNITPAGLYERDPREMKTTFILHQNYPNPFNPSTTIEYELSKPGWVRIQIIDVNGRLIRTLLSGYRSVGRHQVIWDGRNEDLQRVASGVYLYRMYNGNGVRIKKLLYVK
jgi:hypothetical protein